MFEIIEIENRIRDQVIQFITINWGAPKIISRGKVHYIDQLPGYVVLDEDKIIGLITYNIENDECEIVSLDSLEENKGIGSLLIERVETKAKTDGCSRVWLITTNDNSRAIRFYQKRGYDLKAIHRNAINEARKLKPEIPLLGYDNIPIKHELEFEKIIN